MFLFILKNIEINMYLKLFGVGKSYVHFKNNGQFPVDVLENINLEITKGEFVAFFGPNGCGKTTLMNIIAGLLEPDKGSVFIKDIPAKGAKIGYIFQNYRDSLFPWRNSIDNIAFPLELTGMKKDKDYICTNEGFKSQMFSKSKLKSYFLKVNLNVRIITLNPMSYIAIVTK